MPDSTRPPRRFPPPWTVEETAPCFIVRDANPQALAYVYFEDEPWEGFDTRDLKEAKALLEVKRRAVPPDRDVDQRASWH
jgi:hypothetical protein